MLKLIFRINLISIFFFFWGGYLALVALLAEAPDEVAAVGTEGGLLQVDRHELVPIDLVHSPTKGATSLGISKPTSLLELGHSLTFTHLPETKS